MRGRIGLMMQKVGTSAIFVGGVRVPVTLLYLPKTMVFASRTEDKNGYSAVVCAYERRGALNKPQVSELRKSGLFEGDVSKYKLYESRVNAEVISSVSAGDVLSIKHFCVGQFVDASGTTKGRGFAGAMKRHGFAGLRASHGVSISHRSHGSTGMCQDPGRVWKGKKMAGRYGGESVSVQNLRVMEIVEDLSLLVVKGNSIPGYNGAYVFVSDSVKRFVPADSHVPYHKA